MIVNYLNKGGSLKRSLGMAFGILTIPKAFGFEAATQIYPQSEYVQWCDLIHCTRSIGFDNKPLMGRDTA